MYLEFKSNAFYRTEDIIGTVEKMGIAWPEFRDALGLTEIVTGGLFGFQILDAARAQMWSAAPPPVSAQGLAGAAPEDDDEGETA